MIIEGKTNSPTIVVNNRYILVGSVDHGMEIPQASILELTTALEGTRALMMETPEELHRHLNPMSTELLTKASVGKAPVEYLSGNKMDEDNGEHVL